MTRLVSEGRKMNICLKACNADVQVVNEVKRILLLRMELELIASSKPWHGDTGLQMAVSSGSTITFMFKIPMGTLISRNAYIYIYMHIYF